MKLDHIGYITGDILSTSKGFEIMGYEAGEIFSDDIQKCRICFLNNNAGDKIELVEPYEDNTPMQKMLKKRGTGPYHVCYEVEDVNEVYEDMLNKEGWIAIFNPVEAVAFDNRKITYFLNGEIGFVEFVNAK